MMGRGSTLYLMFSAQEGKERSVLPVILLVSGSFVRLGELFSVGRVVIILAERGYAIIAFKPATKINLSAVV